MHARARVLIHSRIGVYSESEHGQSLNSNRVKKLTGSDDITCNPKYDPEITFRPQTKLIFLSNNMPRYDAHDLAMQDRIKLTPCLHRFEKGVRADERSFARR